MKGKKKNGKWSLSAGLLAAIASSVCCIGPLVAAVAGISGAASRFTWMEPLRPYLVGFAVVAMGFAFYQAYKPKKEEHADCCAVEETPKEEKFFQTKWFLWVVTFLSILLLSFPYYGGVFSSKGSDETMNVQAEGSKVVFNVEGMTCSGCEHHIEGDLAKAKGVFNSDASYEEGMTEVIYDSSRISKKEIESIINSTGYIVTGAINTQNGN